MLVAILTGKPMSYKGRRLAKEGGMRASKTRTYRRWEGPLSQRQCFSYDWGRATSDWPRSWRNNVSVQYDMLLDEAIGVLVDRALDTAHPLYYYDAIYWQQVRAMEEGGG